MQRYRKIRDICQIVVQGKVGDWKNHAIFTNGIEIGNMKHSKIKILNLLENVYVFRLFRNTAETSGISQSVR